MVGFKNKNRSQTYYSVWIFVQLMIFNVLQNSFPVSSRQPVAKQGLESRPSVPKAGLKNEDQVCNHLHLCCGPGHH